MIPYLYWLSKSPITLQVYNTIILGIHTTTSTEMPSCRVIGGNQVHERLCIVVDSFVKTYSALY